jgi:hypothetical protein
LLCSLLEDEGFIHPMDPTSNFFSAHSGEYEGNICMAPPFIESPQRGNDAFITLQCGTVMYPVNDFEVHMRSLS